MTQKIDIRAQFETLKNQADRLDSIVASMNEILAPKQVWADFNFQAGRILGILRSIAQNALVRQELFEVTGLCTAHLDLYQMYCGNLPFIRNNGVVDSGRPMNADACRQVIQLVAKDLGVEVSEEMLSDITQERWDGLVKAAYERIEANKQQSITAITYTE